MRSWLANSKQLFVTSPVHLSRGIGYVHQMASLIPRFSCRNEKREPGTLFHMPVYFSATLNDSIEWLLSCTNLCIYASCYRPYVMRITSDQTPHNFDEWCQGRRDDRKGIIECRCVGTQDTKNSKGTSQLTTCIYIANGDDCHTQTVQLVVDWTTREVLPFLF